MILKLKKQSSRFIDISEQIEMTSKAVDRFYLFMLETTEGKDRDRAYSNFLKDYMNIEVELNSLLSKNKIRPLNENSAKICEITLELWLKYKTEQKRDDTLNNNVIKL